MADGGTATRPGVWPTLEYDIITTPGQNNTVGSPIYLPQLNPDNKLCVTPSTGGTLTVPQVPGFSLTSSLLAPPPSPAVRTRDA